MIKKLSISLLFIFIAFNAYSQTIVSTDPENKKVVLEEYTGIYCGWCPEGHALAQALQDNNPDDVYLINIHVGGYANPTGGDPDFRTPFGTAIANEAGVAFYPSGSINRHVFSGGASAMGRDQWTSKANQTLGESSFVNVGVEAEIDITTNILTVHVEAYYTGNSPEDTNLLNIALLQNNTTGPQSGGGQGNNYNHMHRLVHMLTGQWGETIATTTTGSFIDETFTYTIPADYNGIPTDILDMEIVAFVTDTHQELTSGSGAYPTYSGITDANDAYLVSIENIDQDCQTSIIPHLNVQNIGQDEITSLAIEYTINSGAVETYNWTGSILSLYTETIALPEITGLDSSNTIEISLPDDNNNTNNTLSDTYEGYFQHAGGISVVINTDSNGAECTWDIKTLSGAVLTSGGPYENNETIERIINLGDGCYIFNLYDSGNNGGNTVVLSDSANTIIYDTDGDYSSLESTQFSTDGIVLAITDNVFNNLVIYPNPASSILNIDNAENSTIEVYDLLGRVLLSRTNISLREQLNVSTLNSGTYLIRISNENKVVTDKFIINR